MKALVTILQCRRVVTPYLFIRHALPRMRQLFPGELEVLLIQHEARASSNPRLQSSALPAARQDLVREWTHEGRYAGAQILRHDTWHAPYPSLPSMQFAAERALDFGADFHVWLEDDALLMDPDCARWEELMGTSEVAIYRPGSSIINTAWFVSRPSFDARILPGMRRRFLWRRFSRIEPWFRKKARGPLAEFPAHYATRNHHKEYPYTGMKWLAAHVAELCPDELDLLALDFGQEALAAIAELRAGRGPAAP